MDDSRNTKKIYEADLTQRPTKWRLKNRWNGDVENDIKVWELLTGDEWLRIWPDGGQQGRRLLFLDSGATE